MARKEWGNFVLFPKARLWFPWEQGSIAYGKHTEEDQMFHLFGYLDILWFLFSFTLFFSIFYSPFIKFQSWQAQRDWWRSRPASCSWKCLEKRFRMVVMLLMESEFLMMCVLNPSSLFLAPSLREFLVFVYAFILICGTDGSLILCLCAEVSPSGVSFVLVLVEWNYFTCFCYESVFCFCCHYGNHSQKNYLSGVACSWVI